MTPNLLNDNLNYERQIVAWAGAKDTDALVCHYENIWQRVNEISAFIGFPLILPARRERSAKPEPKEINQKLFQHLRKVTRQSDLLLGRESA